jgi:hypothetical protein
LGSILQAWIDYSVCIVDRMFKITSCAIHRSLSSSAHVQPHAVEKRMQSCVNTENLNMASVCVTYRTQVICPSFYNCGIYRPYQQHMRQESRGKPGNLQFVSSSAAARVATAAACLQRMPYYQIKEPSSFCILSMLDWVILQQSESVDMDQFSGCPSQKFLHR